jgi:serine/threonine protein kinase
MRIDNNIINNRYKILRQLSSKAGRQTFLAQDLCSNSLAVIKILFFDNDFQWDDLKLFEREVDTLKCLEHLAIPKYLDYFEIEEAEIRGFALVQTYIDAPSLDSVIMDGRKFSEAEIVELADKLLSILQYLHEQEPPIIHRDIKPSNILLSNRSAHSIGDIYLVDFGSVQTLASKDGGTITIVGSYGYIPLEQFGGQAQAASDLYSLGMTLIYLLTGIHPAELPSVNGIVQFDNSNLSGRFVRWLNKITQPHLAQRFDSAQSAQIALTSNEENSGDFVNLKPISSKVRLIRSQNKLKIVINEDPAGITWIIVAAVIVLYIVCVLIGAHSSLIVMLAITSFLGIFICSFNPYCRKIVINDTCISNQSSTHKKMTNNNLSILVRSNINFLAYSPGYTFNQHLDSSGVLLNQWKDKKAPELILYSGSQKYLINDGLSQAEIWWLGQELSDFLNLKLQIIGSKPNILRDPKAPENNGCGGCCC